MDRWMDRYIDGLIGRNSNVCMPEQVIVYDDQIISDGLYVPPASFWIRSLRTSVRMRGDIAALLDVDDDDEEEEEDDEEEGDDDGSMVDVLSGVIGNSEERLMMNLSSSSSSCGRVVRFK